jgi:UDP-N-acetylmuramate--alanine ligase
LSFEVLNQKFEMNAIGQHSVENATAAIAVANQIGVDLKTCAKVYQNTKEFTVVIKFWDKKMEFG